MGNNELVKKLLQWKCKRVLVKKVDVVESAKDLQVYKDVYLGEMEGSSIIVMKDQMLQVHNDRIWAAEYEYGEETEIILKGMILHREHSVKELTRMIDDDGGKGNVETG